MSLGQGLGLGLAMRIRFGPHQWRLFLSACVLLFVFVAASASPVSDSIIPRMVGAESADTNSQPQFQSGQEQKVDCRETLVQREVGTELVKPPRQISVGRRRFLSGPGSSPPTCITKCMGCTPCIAVYISVEARPTQEYYPVAWRCKCGNNLYAP